MSTALFKSKQFKSKKNLKGLLISPPVLANSTSALLQSAPLKQTLVLRAIYDFKAESDCELTVNRGDYLKLLDKPGDGWLFVQILEKYESKGLVPASYVDIEVNDTQSPVSREWLHETRESTPVQEKFSVSLPSQQQQQQQTQQTQQTQKTSVPSSATTSSFATPRTTLTTPKMNVLSPMEQQRQSHMNQQNPYFNNNYISSRTSSPSSSTESSPKKANQSYGSLPPPHFGLSNVAAKATAGATSNTAAPPSSGAASSKRKSSTTSTRNVSGLQISTTASQPVEDDFDFFQKDSSAAPSPISSSFRFKTVAITNVLQYDNRFYYRIDVNLENKTKRYIMKTYQDFYNLHINLSVLNINEKTLPKLPQPIRQQTKSSLLIRCNELNVYLNKLVKNEYFKNCDELVNWLTNEGNQEYEQRILNNMVSDDDINQFLLPDSIDMISQNSSQKSKYSTTAPLPPTVPANSNTGFESLQSPIRSTNNVKYSSYMNQKLERKNSVASSHHSASTQYSTPRKPFPHSNSSNTLESYGSLIDRYDAIESITNNSISNHSFTSHSLSNQMGQTRDGDDDDDEAGITKDDNENGDDKEDGGDGKSGKKHISSSSDSDSLFSQSKDSNSPTTPIMEGTSFEENISTSPITPGTPPMNKRESLREDRTREKIIISPTRIKLNDFVKVKVVLNNQEDDIIVLKVFKRELHHMDDLKKIVSEKIYKDANLINHYKLELNDNSDEYEIMQCLLQSNKVNLKLIRLR